MRTEKVVVDFIRNFSFNQIPEDVLQVVKNVVLIVCGTTIAGKKEEGIWSLYQYYKKLGGIEEATVFMFNDKLPAEHAALINGAMARALDYCDAMVPGLHMGSTAVPVALASSEITGHVSGKEFLTALTIGLEVGSRLNLTEEAYNGFDPTGIVSGFVATSIASRLLKLDERECWNALGLSLNRAGGSFQSNIDGTLAVRVVQGWTAYTGIMCARYARHGITGPLNFLEGIYGYYHLYGRDLLSAESAYKNIGNEFYLKNTVFKKFPACGATQSSIEAILELVKERGLKAREVESIKIEVTPYVYNLVGHEFKIGDNPRVDAQFNIKYCVASSLLRGSCRLEHFEESYVKDPTVNSIVDRIEVIPCKELDQINHTAIRMSVKTKNNVEYLKEINVAPGFPGNPLTEEEHLERFLTLTDYGNVDRMKARRIIDFVSNLEFMEDVKDLIGYMRP
ncbi:MAG: MmgE/PrpD family protein [Deltaproteobacteria bacterium]|nr:MmgE/PrpD family protein [Deltaproteobacteria bacterium]